MHESSWSNYVKYHAYDQLNELRKAGKIKRLGFSFHGSAEQLAEILAAGDWDFVQLQLNYFDWDYQQSRKKYELCAAAGLQVIVMEPVRGGMLNTLALKPPPCCIRPPRKRAWPAGPFAGLPACPMCCAYFPA